MTEIIFISLLTVLFPLQAKALSILATALENEVLCEQIDPIKLIEFPHDREKCLRVVLDSNNEMNCMFKLSGVNFISLKVTSLNTLKRRDISTETEDKCETFLIFAESIADVDEIFKSKNGDKKKFFPFSKIYFYLNSEEFNNASDSTIAHFRAFLIENALFGYIVDVSNEKKLIMDLLTNEPKQSIPSNIPSDLLHPTVDTRLAKDNFRISVYNCKPFTNYRENASYDEIVKEMDGTEFRFVEEVTKNWKKTINLRDYSRTNLSPYITLVGDLTNKSSDLAMCSIWLLKKNYELYDLTTFYDLMCSTFIVPKPIQLHEATALYKALSPFVWTLLLCVFLLTSFTLNFISKVERSLDLGDAQYADFSMAILEAISVVTSHSVIRCFPSNAQVSAQIILISWILFSMLVDICYSTTYTSKLTKPAYEKPINTVKQFLDYDLRFCGRYKFGDSLEEFRSSINKDYNKLAERSIIYGENEALLHRLVAERKCGIFVVSVSEKYVSLTKEETELLQTFRLMDDCVSTHFTGFALQKYSPYTKLFNLHIRRYQEHGIIVKWYLDFSREQTKIRSFFNGNIDNSVRQIHLVNISGSFFLLGAGLVLSIISLCVEILIATSRISS